MAMTNTHDFWQHGLESEFTAEPQGVCFRESFKWLACRIYGQPFKFESSNAQKVIGKQANYLQPIAPFEGPKAKFETFFAAVHRISLQTLNQWGTKDSVKTQQAKYRLRFDGEIVQHTLSGCGALMHDAQMVIGMYGNADKTGPWAHAVALYRKGAELVYFDPNGGEFAFDPGDQIGAQLMNHFRYRDQPYVGKDGGVTYNLARFGLYRAVLY